MREEEKQRKRRREKGKEDGVNKLLLSSGIGCD